MDLAYSKIRAGAGASAKDPAEVGCNKIGISTYNPYCELSKYPYWTTYANTQFCNVIFYKQSMSYNNTRHTFNVLLKL